MKVKPKVNQILLLKGEFDANIRLSTSNVWYARENKYKPDEMIVTRKGDVLTVHVSKEQFAEYFKEI